MKGESHGFHENRGGKNSHYQQSTKGGGRGYKTLTASEGDH